NVDPAVKGLRVTGIIVHDTVARARVVEGAADGVLLSERLDRPVVGGRSAREGESCEHRNDDPQPAAVNGPSDRRTVADGAKRSTGRAYSRRVPETHHSPLDAQLIPRFAGIRTFMRAPHVTDLSGVDAVVYGIPFDTATSYRTGARFGPEAIRSVSVLIRPYHPVHDVNVVEALSIVDYGDLPVSPGNTERTYEQVQAALGPLVESGVFLAALGGDHSITLPELRALAQPHGPLALVQLDAHAD